MMEMVFYVPGQPWVIDYAKILADGSAISQLQGHTFEEVKTRNPGAVLISLKSATEQIEAGCKSDPRQIDAEDFDYALNVLPPVQWVSTAGCESFKMSERTNGRVTAIYARLGGTYWRFEDIYTLSHADIMAKVNSAQHKQPAALAG